MVERAVLGQPAWGPGPLAEHRRRSRSLAGALILAVLAEPSWRSGDGQCLALRPPLAPATAACPDAVSPPCSLAWPRRKRGAVATRTCPKKPVLKYPLGAAAEQPRRPPDLVQRFPGAHVGRRCKRDQNLAPQNARRGRLKDPTRTTKNEPDAAPAATRTALRLLRRARASAEPSAPARLETTSGK